MGPFFFRGHLAQNPVQFAPGGAPLDHPLNFHAEFLGSHLAVWYGQDQSSRVIHSTGRTNKSNKSTS